LKWIALALFMIAAVGLGLWLRGKPKQAPIAWGLLGFLPFVIGPWHLIVSPFATPSWSGYVKGWDYSLIDSVAIAVIVGTNGRWPKIVSALPLFAYTLAVAVGVYEARFGNLAASYLFQIIRVYLVFLAACRVSAMEQGHRAVLTGMVLGLFVQAVYALVARAGGALQTGGSLGHQNLLGFVSHLALMPAFAMFLANKWTKTAFLGLASGLIVVILTVSRATIAFSAVGLVLTLLLCLMLRFNARKAAVGAIGTLLLLVSIPFATAGLERRFQAQNTSFFAEDLERVAFEKAAWAMIADSPLGVGPNHYVFIANTEGYSERAGVIWSSGSRSTNVHNSYLLVLAETGYLGLLTLSLVFASGLFYAFSSAVRFRKYVGSEVFIGLGCALISLILHSSYEWMLVIFPSQYLLAVVLGLISGMRSFYSLKRSEERSKISPERDDNARRSPGPIWLVDRPAV
jgi:hypothetical protein